MEPAVQMKDCRVGKMRVPRLTQLLGGTGTKAMPWGTLQCGRRQKFLVMG